MAKPSDVPSRKPRNDISQSAKSPKPSFVRKPFLTERPFKNDARLLAMRDILNKTNNQEN